MELALMVRFLNHETFLAEEARTHEPMVTEVVDSADESSIGGSEFPRSRPGRLISRGYYTIVLLTRQQ